MQGPDYKKKYMELRSKYMGDIDVAFRLGFEAGGQQAQQQQALEAEAQANEQQHQMDLAEAGGMAPGAPGESGAPGAPGGAGGPSGSPAAAPGSDKQQGDPDHKNPAGNMQSQQAGTELDHHIGKLESMLGSDKSPDIKKSLDAIIALRKSEKQAVEMKKSQEAIAGIAKALHKPAFKIGVQASHNMNDNAKKAVSMQHKIVNDVMKKWETEEGKAKDSIENILNIEGLLKE